MQWVWLGWQWTLPLEPTWENPWSPLSGNRQSRGAPCQKTWSLKRQCFFAFFLFVDAWCSSPKSPLYSCQEHVDAAMNTALQFHQNQQSSPNIPINQKEKEFKNQRFLICIKYKQMKKEPSHSCTTPLFISFPKLSTHQLLTIWLSTQNGTHFQDVWLI